MPSAAFASWILFLSPSFALFTACLSSGYASVLTLASVLALLGYCSTFRDAERENWRKGLEVRTVLEDVVAKLRNIVCAVVVGGSCQ